jgi:excisionase family DNA binding protein
MHNIVSLRGLHTDRGRSVRQPAEPINRPLTYTVEQVAEMLRISRSTAYRCIDSGEIPCLRLRRRIVVPAAAIDAMLAGPAPA